MKAFPLIAGLAASVLLNAQEKSYLDQLFAFNAYDCTTDNLTKAVYQFDLRRGGDITLNLDYATSGVGCTARGIIDAYRVYPAGYERTLTIRPVSR